MCLYFYLLFYFFLIYDFISYHQLILVFVSIFFVCKGKGYYHVVCPLYVCVSLFVHVWDGMGRRNGEEGWVGGISYELEVGLFLLEYPIFYDFYALL